MYPAALIAGIGFFAWFVTSSGALVVRVAISVGMMVWLTLIGWYQGWRLRKIRESQREAEADMAARHPGPPEV